MVIYFLLIHFGNPLCCPSRWCLIMMPFEDGLNINIFCSSHLLFFLLLFIVQLASWENPPQEMRPNQSWYNAWLSWWHYIRGYLWETLSIFYFNSSIFLPGLSFCLTPSWVDFCHEYVLMVYDWLEPNISSCVKSYW